jgi:hypothetical protein
MPGDPAPSACKNCALWLYRLSFIVVVVTLAFMIGTLYTVGSKPIIVTHEYSLLFNVIFVAFILPLIATTMSALMDYATFKTLFKATICSYIIMSVIV